MSEKKAHMPPLRKPAGDRRKLIPRKNPTKLTGIILIAAGCLGLAYGGFSYTKETTGVKLGPIELKIQEKETVNVPLIVSA